MPSIKVLFDFHIMIDTDFGIIKFIQTSKKLRKPAFFQERVLNLPDDQIIQLLNIRPSYNPLDVIAAPEKRGQFENIYRQIMSDDSMYEDVLNKSKETLILETYRLFKRMDNQSECTILYYTDKELEFIVNKLKIPKESCLKYEPDMDITDYGTVYMAIYADLMKFDRNSIQGKNIYIPDFTINVDKFGLTDDLSELVPKQVVSQHLYPNNIVKIISIYNNMEENK